MKKNILLIILITTIILPCCSTLPATVPTVPSQPIETATVEPTETKTPMPTETEISITFVTLGSPFAANCGDGIPRINDNGSFNGPFRSDGFDQFHGHMDILAPTGCDIFSIEGEFLSPATGFVTKYTFPEPDFGENGIDYGYKLKLPEKTFLLGTVNALMFAGVENPDIEKVTNTELDFGHINIIEGYVEKGQSIGEVRGSPGFAPENKLAWQVGFTYEGIDYMFSPTLFQIDGPEWTCAAADLSGCTAKPFNYAE